MANKANEIIELSDIEHVLKRQAVYLGSIKPTIQEGFFLNEDDTFTYQEYECIGGLLKIINEIIDNSVDEAIRTNFEFANQIDVKINSTLVSVSDNGRGIPVVKDKNSGVWGPVMAFTHARAGSNFSDENRVGMGMNGLGSFITNCFSKSFIANTHDGKKHLNLVCTNNLSNFKVKTKRSTKHGTDVSFEPDLERFGVSEIDTLHIQLIKERLTHLAVSYPKIKFKFNDKLIRVKQAKTYLKCFSENFEYIEDDNFIIAVMPNDSDDFRHLSYVNGLHISNGGNHIDLVLGEVITRIRDRYQKRFPAMKPGDVKNKLQIVTIFKNFNNPQFDSQTKERLTNGIGEIRDFIGQDINWDKFGASIIKNSHIIDPIIDTYIIKEEFKKRKEASDENTKLLKKRVRLEKYFPPNTRNKFLFLCEGDSAFNGICPILGRKEIAYYAMKGVPLNAYEVTDNKILSNNEFKCIIQILGMNLTKEIDDCSFEYIVLANDQDADGAHIQGLMIGFFNKKAPKLIEQGRLLRFRTPLIVFKKKGKIVQHFFSFGEYNEFIENNSTHGLELKYFKGLGTWEPDELRPLIREFGFNYFLERITFDDTANEYIHNWLSKKTSDERKEYIGNTKLDILAI